MLHMPSSTLRSVGDRQQSQPKITPLRASVQYEYVLGSSAVSVPAPVRGILLLNSEIGILPSLDGDYRI